MDNDLILSTGSSAIVMAYLLEALKKSRWFPWLSLQTENLNRLFGVLASGATSLGIHAAFDSTAGTLMVSGLTAAGTLHGLWQWMTQWAVQQFAYKTAIAPNNLLAALGELMLILRSQQSAMRADVKDVKEAVRDGV